MTAAISRAREKAAPFVNAVADRGARLSNLEDAETGTICQQWRVRGADYMLIATASSALLFRAFADVQDLTAKDASILFGE